MEDILLEILEKLRNGESLDARGLQRLIRAHNRDIPDNRDHFAKKQLMPFYLRTKADDPARWRSWRVDEALERKLVATLQVKPRRTASGVATITVLTKPWSCGSACLYCPNDLRMPKSYLADEPACQRAERNCFDPYLQVTARLNTLRRMGHTTDKVELIVLGGTWSDYPRDYQVWFVTELFRALNEADEHGLDALEEAAAPENGFGSQAGAACPTDGPHPFSHHTPAERRAFYEACGVPSSRDDCATFVAEAQREVDGGSLTYNAAMARLYGSQDAPSPWQRASARQAATLDDLDEQHARNEQAAHRVVGLVVETRPDAVTAESLRLIRRIGCTKVQLGIQSLDEGILRANRRDIDVARIARAFALLRLFGFKIHAHFMANLLGATPEADKADYRRLVEDPAFLPDEVKLYPCALVAGTKLLDRYRAGAWRPYTELELLDVLADDVLATPPFVRISRMIRDISAHDIVAGNKKINLRQTVDRKIAQEGGTVREIRSREISTDPPDLADLSLEDVAYRTAVSCEHFLQWTAPDGRIAGFLRLSLPDGDAVARLEGAFDEPRRCPVARGQAMIREVHVYGAVAGLHQAGDAAQHHGLGRRLVEEACRLAREAGYGSVNVISSVGTRAYYRRLGFVDAGLYQRRTLVRPCDRRQDA